MKNKTNYQTIDLTSPKQVLFTVCKGFRVLNLKTREQFYTTTKQCVIAFLAKEGWDNYEVVEGEFPALLF